MREGDLVVSAPHRLLLIDDYDDLRLGLCVRLRQKGYDCKSVSSGEEALALMDSFAPDLVIMEWQLRDGSGNGLGSRLKAAARDQGRTVLVVFSIAPESESDAVAGSDAFDAYVEKLGNVDDLERVLYLLLPPKPEFPS